MDEGSSRPAGKPKRALAGAPAATFKIPGERARAD
jgi:hypothetical protein